MKYQNRKNGKVAEFVRDNGDKFKTVTLCYEDGKEFDYQYSTLKKSFKKLPDEDDKYVAEIMEQKKELGIECPTIDPKEVEVVSDPKEDVASDGTPFTDVMKEIQEGAKERAKQVKRERAKQVKRGRKKKEIGGVVTTLITHVDKVMDYLGGIVKVPKDDKMKFRALCNADGRQVCKLMWSADKIRLYFRTDMVCEAYTDYVKVNYNLPYLYEIGDCADATLEKVKDLLILAVNNDHRKTKKGGK